MLQKWHLQCVGAQDCTRGLECSSVCVMWPFADTCLQPGVFWPGTLPKKSLLVSSLPPVAPPDHLQHYRGTDASSSTTDDIGTAVKRQHWDSNPGFLKMKLFPVKSRARSLTHLKNT